MVASVVDLRAVSMVILGSELSTTVVGSSSVAVGAGVITSSLLRRKSKTSDRVTAGESWIVGLGEPDGASVSVLMIGAADVSLLTVIDAAVVSLITADPVGRAAGQDAWLLARETF